MRAKKFIVFFVILASALSAFNPPPLTPGPSSIFFDLSIENPRITRDIKYFVTSVADSGQFLHFETFPMSNMTLNIYICGHILITTEKPMNIILGTPWVEHIILMAQKLCSNEKYLMTAVAYPGIVQPVTVMFTIHPHFKARENNTTRVEIPLGAMIANQLLVEPNSLAKNGSGRKISTLYTVEMNGMVAKAVLGKRYIKIFTDSEYPVTITWMKCGLVSNIGTRVDHNREIILGGEILNVLNMLKSAHCHEVVSQATVDLILTTHSFSTGTVTISLEDFVVPKYIGLMLFGNFLVLAMFVFEL